MQHKARRLVLLLLLLYKRKRIKTRRYLLRSQLPIPTEAPWMWLKRNRNDRGFLSTMGLDIAAFDWLLTHFHRDYCDFYDRNSTKGRKTLLTTEDVLALILHYLSSQAEQNIIGRLFGLTAASTSRYLWNGMNVLFHTLKHLKEAEIRFPSCEKMQELSDNLTEVEPSMRHVFGFVDGLNSPINDPQDPFEQNAYYNGWLSGCFVSAVILYGVDGRILWVSFNAPGSWHDAKIARRLYDLLIHRCPEPFAILADTAFPRNEELRNKILSPLKENELDRLSRDEREVRAQSRVITSVRQAAEWGMRTVQSVNPRLKVNLPSDKNKRAMLLELVFRLHNLRAAFNLPNQIRSVYWNNESVVECSMFYQ